MYYLKFQKGPDLIKSKSYLGSALKTMEFKFECSS